MAANVVTFTVQIGSGGFPIARAVAEKLGFAYYDWEITSEAASRAGVPPDVLAASERVPGFLERMMRRLVSASAVSGEETAFLMPEVAVVSAAVQSLNLDDYRQFIEKVVLELAGRGDAVIVGHAAQATLHDVPGVVKVLLYGTMPVRAQRIAGSQNTTLAQATASLKQSDRDRTELFTRVYKLDWLEASNYDLAFNTDRLPPDVAVEAVVAAAKAVP